MILNFYLRTICNDVKRSLRLFNYFEREIIFDYDDENNSAILLHNGMEVAELEVKTNGLERKIVVRGLWAAEQKAPKIRLYGESAKSDRITREISESRALRAEELCKQLEAHLSGRYGGPIDSNVAFQMSTYRLTSHPVSGSHSFLIT